MKTLRQKHFREYCSWAGMKTRCYNKNSPGYRSYGERGTIVCDRWRNSFKAFFQDMGSRPAYWHIHRIDTFGNYEPRNCMWIDPVKHSQVPRRPHRPHRSQIRKLSEKQLEVLAYIVFNNSTPTLREIGKHFNFSYQAAQCFIKVLEKKGKITTQYKKARSIRIA